VRVCLDTNVIVSAFATRGLSADVMRVVLSEHELLVPTQVLEEVERVLREKFDASPEAIELALEMLSTQTIVDLPGAPIDVPIRDADDARILSAAVARGADVLVTGDKDLLSVATASPIPILTPREFWNTLRAC